MIELGPALLVGYAAFCFLVGLAIVIGRPGLLVFQPLYRELLRLRRGRAVREGVQNDLQR
jgi:hypothetical protein